MSCKKPGVMLRGFKRDFSRTRGEANDYKSGTGSGIKNYRKQPTNGLRTRVRDDGQ